jgi:hypothetical protein
MKCICRRFLFVVEAPSTPHVVEFCQKKHTSQIASRGGGLGCARPARQGASDCGRHVAGRAGIRLRARSNLYIADRTRSCQPIALDIGDDRACPRADDSRLAGGEQTHGSSFDGRRRQQAPKEPSLTRRAPRRWPSICTEVVLWSLGDHALLAFVLTARKPIRMAAISRIGSADQSGESYIHSSLRAVVRCRMPGPPVRAPRWLRPSSGKRRRALNARKLGSEAAGSSSSNVSTRFARPDAEPSAPMPSAQCFVRWFLMLANASATSSPRIRLSAAKPSSPRSLSNRGVSRSGKPSESTSSTNSGGLTPEKYVSLNAAQTSAGTPYLRWLIASSAELFATSRIANTIANT